MQIFLTVLCALLALAALFLTAAGAWKTSFRLGWLGGGCFMLAAVAALVLGLEGNDILLASLVLLCVSQVKRRNGHEL